MAGQYNLPLNKNQTALPLEMLDHANRPTRHVARGTWHVLRGISAIPKEFTLKPVYVYYPPAFHHELNKGSAYEKRIFTYVCSRGRRG
jgi:hypothetical protein